MDFLDKKPISEGIVDFTVGKRYMLIYEDGTIGIISRPPEKGEMNYCIRRFKSINGRFSEIYYKSISNESKLAKKINKLEEEGVFKS
jgi:hypothetical protein